jgi:phenylpropionate dioxygenase-like ring-hydroxylating dioxygenase large terminal subunit
MATTGFDPSTDDGIIAGPADTLTANPTEVQEAVPFAITDTNFVPRERYYSREFFELEKERLWPHSWLMAARLEEIPYPGDYTEFEVIGKSILIVRQRDGSVKALHNACRHRATELAKGCGRFPGGQIACPFHGWRWNLDGSNSFVFGERTFAEGTLDRDELALGECQVEVWAGQVWINMDQDAAPLMEALGPVAPLLDGVGIGNMRTKWWKQVVLNANWKMVQEAFLEAYHTTHTHPQLLLGGTEEEGALAYEPTELTAFKGGHGRFEFPVRTASNAVRDDSSGIESADAYGFEQFLKLQQLLWSGMDAMAIDRDIRILEGLRNKIDPHDETFAQQAVMAIYEHAAGAGIPMPPLSEKMTLWGGEVFLFPHYIMLPQFGNCLVYRARPYNDDPEWCLFDVWSLTTYPEGDEPERAELAGVFDKDDDENWGLIPRQDFSNIERQQRGLHSHGYERLRFSNVQEKTIINMHLELDRVLADGGRPGR